MARQDHQAHNRRRTEPDTRPRVIAVASGKGGTGKSLVAANVGIFLATLGKRVTLVDCSFGAPNLHLFAGVPRPARSLHEAFTGEPHASFRELAQPTGVPGLQLIGGTFDPATMPELAACHTSSLVEMCQQLDSDIVVLDLASGLGADVLDLFVRADQGILVAMPDPTSIELVHRFLRCAFLTRLGHAGLSRLTQAVARAPRELEGGLPSALEIYLAAERNQDRDLLALRSEILSFAPYLVVNAARSKADMEMGRAIATAARRRIGVPLGYLGHLEYDEAVWAATRRRRPLLVEHPETRVAKCFERVARGILATRAAPQFTATDDVLPSDSHYELLDVPPTASFEDLRRANRRIRDVYGAESVVISGLYDPASLEAVHRRLDLAYTTLMDAAKRREYDRELFPEGVPLPVAPVAAVPQPARATERQQRDSIAAATRPAMPVLPPAAEVTGAMLRQVREALGIELREIAERSKIGIAYLQALEDEAWGKLPALVYVRGFVMEYTRLLASATDLPQERLREGYLRRFVAARGLPPDEPVESVPGE